MIGDTSLIIDDTFLIIGNITVSVFILKLISYLNSFQASISSQMDVSKFALDRSAYLNSAAANALYDTTKASAYGGAYLDPTSMLTKAYFDSKMYQDRANYAFDISKIYGQQSAQQNHQLNQNGVQSGGGGGNQTGAGMDERGNTPQLNDSHGDKGQMLADSHVDTTTMNQYGGGGGGGGGSYQGYTTSAQGNNGEFRRPLTVIF